MIFRIKRINDARESIDEPLLRRYANHERTTHGGTTEERLCLLIISHPQLLNRLRSAGRHREPFSIFNHWGAGADGILGILGAIYFHRLVHTYLIEINTRRHQHQNMFLANEAIPIPV